MKTALSLLLATTLGCVAYEPRPVDWQAEAESLATDPVSVTLSDSDLCLRAIAFCPELNALRLEHAAAKAKAEAAGWWEDPSLNADFLRILHEPANPLVLGGSLTFTLPLTGIPALEKKAAALYAEAGYWTVVQAERNTGAETIRLAVTARELQSLVREIESSLSDTNYVDAVETASRLAEVGEIPRTDVLQLTGSARELRQTLNELRHEQAEAEARLRRMALLPPNSRFVWATDEKPPEPPAVTFTPLDFLRQPSVRAALAKLEGGENEVRKEIRRQYPELSLGPAAGREDGQNRFGLSASLSLPLWNRNRAGIATATGERDQLRQSALDTWRDAVYNWYELVREQRNFHTANPFLEENCGRPDEAARLYVLGEYGAADYAGLVHQTLSEEIAHTRQKIDYAAMSARMNAIAEGLKE